MITDKPNNHLARNIQIITIFIIIITLIVVGFQIAHLEGAWFNLIIYGGMIFFFVWYTFYVWRNW